MIGQGGPCRESSGNAHDFGATPGLRCPDLGTAPVVDAGTDRQAACLLSRWVVRVGGTLAMRIFLGPEFPPDVSHGRIRNAQNRGPCQDTRILERFHWQRRTGCLGPSFRGRSC